MAGQRRLAAILFADMVGFSRQVSADESAGLAARRQVEEALRDAAREHHGRVVKTLGDGAMLEFGSAVDAVQCALAVQERRGEAEPRLRIGVHVGDVTEEDGDLFGNAVNLAARLEEAAPPGRVCVSRAVFEQVRPMLHVEAEPLAPADLPDLPEPLEVLVLTAAAATGLRTADHAREAQPKRTAARLTLARAQELAERDEDGLSFAWTVALAFGAAVLAALFNTLAGWAETAPAWKMVAAFLRQFGRVASYASIGVLGWFALRGLLGPLFRRLQYALFGPREVDREILEKCGEMGAVPPALEAPVSRALSAFAGMADLAREDVWMQRNVSVERYTKQTRTELLALLDQAQQLARVAASLERFGGSVPAHYRETAAAYEAQCARLEAAADSFERAEAALSRAFLLLSARGAQPPPEPLAEVAATFTALTDALTELDERPPVPARPEEAQQTVGRLS
jgi:class 3 adenylate cyclase